MIPAIMPTTSNQTIQSQFSPVTAADIKPGSVWCYQYEATNSSRWERTVSGIVRGYVVYTSSVPSEHWQATCDSFWPVQTWLQVMALLKPTQQD